MAEPEVGNYIIQQSRDLHVSGEMHVTTRLAVVTHVDDRCVNYETVAVLSQHRHDERDHRFDSGGYAKQFLWDQVGETGQTLWALPEMPRPQWFILWSRRRGYFLNFSGGNFGGGGKPAWTATLQEARLFSSAEFADQFLRVHGGRKHRRWPKDLVIRKLVLVDEEEPECVHCEMDGDLHEEACPVVAGQVWIDEV